jgi:hypothetical protein
MSLIISTEKDQSFWIDVSGSKFKGCPLTATENAKIDKRLLKYTGGGRLDPESERKATAEKFKRVVEDWEDVKDVHGKDVPYSDDQRDRFAELNYGWASLILLKFDQKMAEVEEEENDNLGKLSSGSEPYEPEV